jgi:uncharacterized protein (DUF1697 family)
VPTSVAFFRNLNLGQGWAPTRPQLVAAFEATGAGSVDNVQVNGTVVFDHPAPVRATREVLLGLRDLTGYDDIAVVRPARWVVRLAASLDDLDLRDDEPSEVSFFDARPPLPIAVPWTSPDGRLRVLAGDHRFAVTSFRPSGGRGSNASAVLQELTGVKVTARGTGTVLRLAARIERR